MTSLGSGLVCHQYGAGVVWGKTLFLAINRTPINLDASLMNYRLVWLQITKFRADYVETLVLRWSVKFCEPRNLPGNPGMTEQINFRQQSLANEIILPAKLSKIKKADDFPALKYRWNNNEVSFSKIVSSFWEWWSTVRQIETSGKSCQFLLCYQLVQLVWYCLEVLYYTVSKSLHFLVSFPPQSAFPSLNFETA